MTETQEKVLTSSTLLIFGFWHGMQESIIVNLDGLKSEWSFLARLWRTTEGRLKFLLGAGSVKDALHEIFSAIAGVVRWQAGRYRLHCAATSQVPDAASFDAFIDEEAERSPVL